MKTLIVMLMLVAVPAFAHPKHKTVYRQAPKDKLELALRVENRWNKVETRQRSEFESDGVGSLVAYYHLRSDAKLFGTAGYQFQAEQPVYSVGIEIKLAGWR